MVMGMRSARIRQAPNCNSYYVGEPSFLAICSRNAEVILGTSVCALNSEEILLKYKKPFFIEIRNPAVRWQPLGPSG